MLLVWVGGGDVVAEWSGKASPGGRVGEMGEPKSEFVGISTVCLGGCRSDASMLWCILWWLGTALKGVLKGAPKPRSDKFEAFSSTARSDVGVLQMELWDMDCHGSIKESPLEGEEGM